MSPSNELDGCNKSYLGRRLLTESLNKNDPPVENNLDCDNSISEKSTDMFTTNNHKNYLSVDTKSLGDNSICSKLDNSESYLKVFSEYATHLPSSVNSLCVPNDNVGQYTSSLYTSVPKSQSATSALTAPLENNFSINNHKVVDNHSNDNVSIGSDTLSGVSEDFSCSLSINPVYDVEERNDVACLDGLNKVVEGNCTNTNNQSNCLDYLATDIKDTITTSNADIEITNDAKNYSNFKCSVEDVRYDDDTCVNEVSLSSVTLPSYSWTNMEETSVASLDINDLIRNSKMLLQNVNQTLQQSKNQSVPCLTGSGGDNSTPVDQSDHHFDSVSTEPMLSTEHRQSALFENIGAAKYSNKYRGQIENLDASQSNLTISHSESELRSKYEDVSESCQLTPLDNRSMNGEILNINLVSSNNKIEFEQNIKTASNSALDTTHKLPDIQNHLIPGASNLIKPRSYTALPDLNGMYLSKQVDQALQVSQRSLPDLLTSVNISSLPTLEKLDSCMDGNDLKVENEKTPEKRLMIVEQDVSLSCLLSKYSAAKNQTTRPLLPEGIVKVWVSQVVSAIAVLHTLGVIWG